MIPARLRYQACDDKVCFRPITAPITLDAAGGGHRRSQRPLQLATVLTSCPPAVARVAGPTSLHSAGPHRRRLPPAQRRTREPIPTQLDDFTVLATTGGYLGRDDFLQFIRDAEQGVARKGLFEGRGPLAILVLILLGGLR